MTNQLPLLPDAPKKCRDCFEPLLGAFDAAYGQCTPCTHRETEHQLLSWLRQAWQAHPEKRDLCEAWARYVKESHRLLTTRETP